jgi:Tetratricopeptide repeat
VLGPDHPETLTARSNLAYMRGRAGDATGAVAAFEALLTDELRVLGPDHPETLTARSNLAYMRGRAGDAVGAVAAFEALLTDRLRVLGPDHLDTLTTCNDLAHWDDVTQIPPAVGARDSVAGSPARRTDVDSQPPDRRSRWSWRKRK